MPDQNEETLQPPASPEPPASKKQLSPLAMWSFRCLAIGFILSFVGLTCDPPEVGMLPALICWVLALVLGFCALVKIGNSNEKLGGIPRSLISVFISGILLCLALISSTGPKLNLRLMCGVNLGSLGKAIAIYMNDSNDRLPTASRWCDLLVERADAGLGSFVCRSSDATHGESSYAMNKYIAGMNAEQFPADVVVLFETDSGRTAKRSWGKLCYTRDYDYYCGGESNDVVKLARASKRDKLRWNQVGGPEILTTDHHDGKGCNILFGDGHVSFETTESISKLRWKP